MKYRHEIVPKHEPLPIRFFLSRDGVSLVLPHWHGELEVLYLLTGSVEVCIDGQVLHLLPGSMCIINCNHIHSTRSDDPSTTAYVLQIAPSFLEAGSPGAAEREFQALVAPGTAAADCLPAAKQLLEALYTCEGNAQDEHRRLLQNALLYQLLYLLMHRCSHHRASRARRFRHSQRQRLAEITSYINTHYMHPLTLAQAAKMAGITPPYLSRFFKAHMGVTFSAYLSTVRLEHAHRLVTTTLMPMQQVAEESGFASYALFVNKYKAAYGATPLKSRKRTV